MNEDNLGALWGARAIAAFLDIPPRKAFHLLETGAIPATKKGRIWCTTRARLRADIEGTPPKGGVDAPAE